MYLYSSKNKRVGVPFRLITAKDKEDKPLLFVTNLKETAAGKLIPAENIILIYKYIWDIELFFRFIK